MRKKRLNEVGPGERLGRSLYFANGEPMLKAGARLDEPILEKLGEMGYETLIIYDEETKNVEVLDFFKEDQRVRLVAHVKELYDGIQENLSS